MILWSRPDVSAAHEDALTKCEILHRDVSAGNILILPKVIADNEVTYFLWVGVLSDWELSKRLPGEDEEPKARQPHRTVCRRMHFQIPPLLTGRSGHLVLHVHPLSRAPIPPPWNP